jgi:signal transduction histidine kinase
MVTQRRGTKPEPGRSVEELQEALAARDELIAVMGHELRNAMSPVSLLSETFEAHPPADPALQRKLGMLTRYLRSFHGTLDRVSEIAQLRAGKLTLNPETVDAAEVVTEVVEQLGGQLEASQCEVRRSLDSVVGHWDRARLGQIVRHLLTNALRYGSAPIDLIVRDDHGQLELIVHDHGPGIPVEERARLFDRFGRSNPRKTGGLGVGLWVVRTLCQAMGGTVALDDTEAGARFCVSLPRA